MGKAEAGSKIPDSEFNTLKQYVLFSFSVTVYLSIETPAHLGKVLKTNLVYNSRNLLTFGFRIFYLS